ncbi:MAG: hypothetical protein KIT14_09385 [bacterium]|nr:hypothetical protein [bacterium]
MQQPTTPKPLTDLERRWLRLKRHLRSCNQSARALRDAARAMQATATLPPLPFAPERSWLCRGSATLLAA